MSKWYRVCIHQWSTNRLLWLSFQDISEQCGGEIGFEQVFHLHPHPHTMHLIEINKVWWTCGALLYYSHRTSPLIPPEDQSRKESDLIFYTPAEILVKVLSRLSGLRCSQAQWSKVLSWALDLRSLKHNSSHFWPIDCHWIIWTQVMGCRLGREGLCFCHISS